MVLGERAKRASFEEGGRRKTRILAMNGGERVVGRKSGCTRSRFPVRAAADKASWECILPCENQPNRDESRENGYSHYGYIHF
mgnify:CR=1 FL=1